MISCRQRPSLNAPVPIYPEGLAFFPPFQLEVLEGHGAFVCDHDLALTVRIRDLNRRFGGLQVSPRLGFACCRRSQLVSRLSKVRLRLTFGKSPLRRGYQYLHIYFF